MSVLDVVLSETEITVRSLALDLDGPPGTHEATFSVPAGPDRWRVACVNRCDKKTIEVLIWHLHHT